MNALVLILLIATGLRLLGALLRPVWVDEAASAIFSSGHSSWQTPINTLVPLEQFLAALRIEHANPWFAGLAALHREDNHPPLHFAITALAGHLLQADGTVLTPLSSRWPAVLLGSLAVPLLHQAILVATGSRRAARLGGLWIAISPLAVSMGLEARHYALAMACVCAAFWGLACSWRELQQGRSLGLWPALGWISANLLGVLSHHLVVVSIAAQLLCLALLAWRTRLARGTRLHSLVPPMTSLLLAGLWLLVKGSGGAVDHTTWLNFDRQQPLEWLLIVLKMLLTALCGVLAPGTTFSAGWQLLFIALAGLGTLIGLISLGVLLHGARRPPSLPLLFTLCSALGLLVFSGLTGKDMSRALRYGFLYLPGVLALLAVACDQAWGRGRQRLVVVLMSCSLLCSFGVAAGVALPASYNPELLMIKVAADSREPIVLAFNERVVNAGRPLVGYEALSVAWHGHGSPPGRWRRGGMDPRWLLLIGDGHATPPGLAALAGLSGRFDLWLINAHGTSPLVLPRQDCRRLEQGSAGGHLFEHLRCGV